MLNELQATSVGCVGEAKIFLTREDKCEVVSSQTARDDEPRQLFLLTAESPLPNLA